jgi:hypothetical protein
VPELVERLSALTPVGRWSLELIFVGPPGLRKKLDDGSILELVSRARGTDGVAVHPADAPRAARLLA